jgi:hypothetical protein
MFESLVHQLVETGRINKKSSVDTVLEFSVDVSFGKL